jgi:signal peptidase II
VRFSIPPPPGGRFRISPGVLATALAVVILDQSTKAWVSQALGQPGRPHSLQIIGDVVRLSYTTNSGAAFGMFPAATLFFTLVALIAAPVLIVAREYVRERAWWMTVLFGMLLGGALGNMLDRLRQGRVVDFIDVGVGDVRFWSFNVADSSFVVGVIILAIYLSLTPEEPVRSSDDRASIA